MERTRWIMVGAMAAVVVAGWCWLPSERAVAAPDLSSLGKSDAPPTVVLSARWEPREGQPLAIALRTRAYVGVEQKRPGGDGAIDNLLLTATVQTDLKDKRATLHEMQFKVEHRRPVLVQGKDGPRQEWMDTGVEASSTYELPLAQETLVFESVDGKLFVAVTPVDAKSAADRD